MDLARTDILLDGAWVAPSCAQSIAVHNPATEEVLASAAAGTAADVDHALKCVGCGVTIRAAWRAARRGGQVTVVGMGARDDVVNLSALDIFRSGRTLRSSVYGCMQVLPGVPGAAAAAQFPAGKQLSTDPFERPRIRGVQPQRSAESAFGVGAAARGQQRVAARGERPPGRAGGAARPLVEDGERGGGRLVPPVDQVEHRERPLGERARAAVRGGRLTDLADAAQAGQGVASPPRPATPSAEHPPPRERCAPTHSLHAGRRHGGLSVGRHGGLFGSAQVVTAENALSRRLAHGDHLHRYGALPGVHRVETEIVAQRGKRAGPLVASGA
ncbi:hypothetical protein [Micromonospora aurantiaca]|uniref:hypothetical protein n=1 Tax=Micromonospora aurantiaca (nom. illeg.) TaxID=47850 RepID=UPI0038221856